jgi:hypothetical protein
MHSGKLNRKSLAAFIPLSESTIAMAQVRVETNSESLSGSRRLALVHSKASLLPSRMLETCVGNPHNPPPHGAEFAEPTNSEPVVCNSRQANDWPGPGSS